MTDSMIPYSFIPGTKARADEVNANFIALASVIEANRQTASNDDENIIQQINELVTTKADKTELVNEYTVTEFDTDLNDYKTKGTYVFTSDYTPVNIPKGTSGILVVTGKEDSVIKQLWFCSGETPEIFTRNFSDDEWEDWQSTFAKSTQTNPGYIRLPNGLLIQWGHGQGSSIAYPIAFSQFACIVMTKHGYNSGLSRSDGGLTSEILSGFSFGSSGAFYHLNYIAIGY